MPTVSSVPLATRLCNANAPVRTGALTDPQIRELSGLGASRTYAGLLWAHNDSGDLPRLYGFDRKGAWRATVNVSGASASDWEDMAVYGKSLYIGDIGDNTRSRPSVTVYRVAEPAFGAQSAAATSFVLRYPDGPHDAEALMVDPIGRRVVIVTKEGTGRSRVYTISLDRSGTLQHVATLNLGNGSMVTAGDISASGSVVVLRTYGGVYVWDRKGGENLATTLGRSPCRPPAPNEPQGEAIALSPAADRYTTVSEGTGAAISETVGR